MSEVGRRSIRSGSWVFVLDCFVLEENHSMLLIKDSLSQSVGFGESVLALVAQVVYLLILARTRDHVL